MKRTLLTLLCVLVVLTGFAQRRQRPMDTLSRRTRDSLYWQQVASTTSDALISNFWGASFPDNATRYYFNYESNQTNLVNIHYWPQAHAMDVVVDAFIRTGEAKYRQLYPLWWDGLPRFNPNATANPLDRWWNAYVDDMEWIVLTQIRMYESTQNPDYFVKAKQMYNDWIVSTWGPEKEEPWRGGITWNTEVKKSKNACSNGPAALIACKIYLNYDSCQIPDSKSKADYLKEAVKIYQWERKHLFNPATGAIADRMEAEKGVVGGPLSYNQGTFLGAAHLLYTITQDKQYLDDALKAADYTIANIGEGEPRLLSNVRTGDGGLFHGIFIRYFVQLVNDTAVPKDKRIAYHQYLTANAELAVSCLVPGVNIFSPSWTQMKLGKGDKGYLNPHVTGATLMEAMCVLKPVE